MKINCKRCPNIWQKTIYNFNVYSDDQVENYTLETAQDASDKGGLSLNQTWNGTASNGIKFKEYAYGDGNIKTGYLVL